MSHQVDENDSSAKRIIDDVRRHSICMGRVTVYPCICVITLLSVIRENMNKLVEIDNKWALMGC